MTRWRDRASVRDSSLQGDTLIIETSDPGLEAVRETVEDYVTRYPDFADALRLYGAIMEVQQSALDDISCPLRPLDPVDIEAGLLSGEPLLDPRAVEIDGPAFRRVLAGICEAVERNSQGGFALSKEILEWEGLSDERLGRTRALVLEGSDLDFEPAGDTSGQDRKIARDLIWEGLAPFYRVCGRMLAYKLEQSSWQRGYCPVCGGAPLMGQYRHGDGLWIVECSLCHTGWNVQRAACPFCEGSQGSLDYLYIEADRSRSEDKILMPLEDIVTMDLDLAAKEEGLTPATGRS
jgi:FdhE protein